VAEIGADTTTEGCSFDSNDSIDDEEDDDDSASFPFVKLEAVEDDEEGAVADVMVMVAVVMLFAVGAMAPKSGIDVEMGVGKP
jgi:hypothetical protein